MTLKNKADRSYGIQPHGLFYESLNNDGGKEPASHHHSVLVIQLFTVLCGTP